MSGFGSTVGGGLVWFYENALKPLGEWAATTLLPTTIEAMASAIGLLDSAAQAIALGLAIFLEAVKPIADWIGVKLIEVINLCSEVLNSWGAWFDEHRETFTQIGASLGEIAANIWAILELLASEAWVAFKEIVMGITAGMQTLAGGALATLADTLTEISDWISENSGFIKDMVLVVGSFVAAWAIALGILSLVSGAMAGEQAR